MIGENEQQIEQQREQQRDQQRDQAITDNFIHLDDRAKFQFIKDRYEVLGRLLESYFYSIDPGLDHRRPRAYFFRERAKMRRLLENIHILTEEQITNLINGTQDFHAIFGNNFGNLQQVFAEFSDMFRDINDDFSFELIFYLIANRNNRRNINPIINNLEQELARPYDIRPIQPWVFNHLILNYDLPEMLEAIQLRHHYDPNDDPNNTERPEPGVDDVEEDAAGVARRNQIRQSRRIRNMNPTFTGLELGHGINPITLGKRPTSARGPEVYGEYISYDEAKGILEYITRSRQVRGNYRSIDGRPLTDDKVDEIREFVRNVDEHYGGRKTRKIKKNKKSKKTRTNKKSKKTRTNKKFKKTKKIGKTKTK